VVEEFHGEVSAEVDVHTGSGGSDCGYGFVEGSTYLVYASGATDGRLSTSIRQPNAQPPRVGGRRRI
jgi:hypothetical protein